jgi:Na+/phosphate symporter
MDAILRDEYGEDQHDKIKLFLDHTKETALASYKTNKMKAGISTHNSTEKLSQKTEKLAKEAAKKATAKKGANPQPKKAIKK